jgi:hypothetical protein
VTVREENAAAAIEVMSRFAVAPAQLLYLPPTMSPSATSTRPGLLEHPAEAFAYFRGGVWPRSSARRNTWAHGRSRSCAVRTSPGPHRASCTRAPGGRFSAPSSPTRSWHGSAPRPTRPGCSRSSTPKGCSSTQSCCRGRSRPVTWSVASTRRSGRRANSASRRGRGPRAGRRAGPRRRRRAGAPASANHRLGGVHTGLSPVLLADRRAGGRLLRAAPAARDGGRDLRRPTGSVASDGRRPPGRSRSRVGPGYPLAHGRRHRPGQRGRGNGVVGGDDRRRWRGDGREARDQLDPRTAGIRSTRPEGPRPLPSSDPSGSSTPRPSWWPCSPSTFDARVFGRATG